jgi:hypothetical protein
LECRGSDECIKLAYTSYLYYQTSLAMDGRSLDALVGAHGLIWKVQHILCEHGRVEARFDRFLIFQASSDVEQVVLLIPLEVTPHFIISWAWREALCSLNRSLWVV